VVATVAGQGLLLGSGGGLNIRSQSLQR